MVEPIFEVGFIDRTFANRIGKGTHRAIGAYERYRDRHAHVLRCDIYRYFPAIDHAILKSDFRRPIACSSTLALLGVEWVTLPGDEDWPRCRSRRRGASRLSGLSALV